MPFGLNPKTGRPGPAPYPPRDGDKEQARQRINVEVRSGRRAHPNALPCVDCGHAWKEGERRHEYDHHLGYASEHHLDVEPVCTKCHSKRDGVRTGISHCARGHEFTEANTTVRENGTRECVECRRRRERQRPPRGAEYWRKINAKRSHSRG